MALEWPYVPTVVTDGVEFYLAVHHNRQGAQVAELTNRVNRFWADDAGRPTPTVDPDFSDPYPTGFNINRGKLEGWNGSAWVQIPLATHKDTHKSGGSDAFIAADLIEAVIKRLRETGGPTNLLLGAIADGEFLKRSGATIIGGAAGVGVSAGEHAVQTARLTLTLTYQIIPGLTKTFTPPSACRAYISAHAQVHQPGNVSNRNSIIDIFVDGIAQNVSSFAFLKWHAYSNQTHSVRSLAFVSLDNTQHTIDVRGKYLGTTGASPYIHEPYAHLGVLLLADNGL